MNTVAPNDKDAFAAPMDVAMEGDRNRKRGPAATEDQKALLLLPASTVDSSTSSPATSEIPPSPPPRQEPKRNKLSAMTAEKTNGKNTNVPKNLDARLARPQVGSHQAQ